MKVEILITADVIVFEDDDIGTLKKEVNYEVRNAVSRFAGSKHNSTPYHENGMYDFIRNVDHEVAFDDEGTYRYSRKE